MALLCLSTPKVPRVSAKRQVTLPAQQCREAGLEPGDEFRSFVADGRITIVRQGSGSAWGCLQSLSPNPAVSDDESRDSALERTRR